MLDSERELFLDENKLFIKFLPKTMANSKV